MKNLNENLKRYRTSLGLTQKFIAENLNITVRAYQRYESGEREPNLDILVAIADIFCISLDDLIGRKLPKSSLIDVK